MLQVSDILFHIQVLVWVNIETYLYYAYYVVIVYIDNYIDPTSPVIKIA